MHSVSVQSRSIKSCPLLLAIMRSVPGWLTGWQICTWNRRSNTTGRILDHDANCQSNPWYSPIILVLRPGTNRTNQQCSSRRKKDRQTAWLWFISIGFNGSGCFTSVRLNPGLVRATIQASQFRGMCQSKRRLRMWMWHVKVGESMVCSLSVVSSPTVTVIWFHESCRLQE